MEHCGLKEEDYCRVVTDQHLEEFTRDCGEGWRLLPAHFEIDKVMVKDLEHILAGEREKRLAFFGTWKHMKGSDATYKNLVYGLLKIRNRADAEIVCKMLQSSQQSGSSESSGSAQAAATTTTGILI